MTGLQHVMGICESKVIKSVFMEGLIWGYEIVFGCSRLDKL
jgi:hypothetical protein